MNFNELYEKYKDRDFDDFKDKEKKEIKEIMRNTTPYDLVTLEDHHRFVEMLNTYRASVAMSDELRGDNFKKQLRDFVAVGADSVYSDNYRFLYELIQNVDDCEYDNKKDCHLNISFDIKKAIIF